MAETDPSLVFITGGTASLLDFRGGDRHDEVPGLDSITAARAYHAVDMQPAEPQLIARTACIAFRHPRSSARAYHRGMNGRTDQELRAEFRWWLDKDAMPSDVKRNLWDEFYALQFRRDQWRGFREMVDASPDDAKHTARYLVEYVFRCHVEAQSSALRRFAYAGKDKRPMSFGRMLRQIAARPTLYGQEASDKAGVGPPSVGREGRGGRHIR